MESMEKQIKQYMRKLEPYTGKNYRVFVRKDFIGGWEVISIDEVEDWAEELGWKDLHCSLQRYSMSSEITEDSERFCDLVIELDDSETMGEVALEETRKLFKWMNKYEPRPGDIRVWFSGNKGFHIIISGVSIGIFPSKDIHTYAAFIAGRICHEVGITTADFQMYSRRKTIRLPNSSRNIIDSSSEDGFKVYHKIELSEDEIANNSMADIRMKAMSQRESLFNREDVDANGPNIKIAGMMRKIQTEYSSMREEVESVEKKILFPKELKGQKPVCIRDIMAYKFPRKGTRNKAMLSLIAFFKDSGMEMNDTIAIVKKWSENVPWDTQKKRQRVSQVPSAASVAYNADGDGYDFSCRKCLSINSGAVKGDKIMACKGQMCPFVEDPMDQGTISEVPISIDDLEKISTKSFETTYRTGFFVDTYGQKIYTVPRSIKGSCKHVPHDPKTHEDICQTCSMPHSADNRDLGPEDTESLFMDKIIHGHNGDSLRYADVRDSEKAKVILKAFGVPKECPFFRSKIMREQKLMTMMVSSPKVIENPFGNEEEVKGKDVNRHEAFLLVRDEETQLPEEGYHASACVRAVTHYKDQSSIFYFSNYKKEHSFLDSFEVSPELNKRLKAAHSVRKDETLSERMHIRASNMQVVCKLINVRKLLTLIDICYHSPLTINLGGKENRGFIHAVIIGDPGQGKSDALKYTSLHYGLGSIEDGANSRRTGLLYTIDNSRGYGARVIWGAIPRMDRQLLIVEEFNLLSSDVLEKLTLARSSGVVKVAGQASGSSRARTRTIMVGNPKAGNARMDAFSCGILAIKDTIKKSQDLRRFDMAMVMRSGDPFTAEELNELMSYKDPDEDYNSLSCRNLVLWSWTRTSDQIKWDDAALKELNRVSVEISIKFKSDISIAENRDMPMRLGRIAQSVAAMVYSASEDGQCLWIMKEHVVYASEFFVEIMTRCGGMDLDHYASMWQHQNIMSKEQERWLETNLRVQPWFNNFARVLLYSNQITDYSLRTMIDCESDTKMSIYTTLIASNMMKMVEGKSKLEKSPKFIKWLKKNEPSNKPVNPDKLMVELAESKRGEPLAVEVDEKDNTPFYIDEGDEDGF